MQLLPATTPSHMEDIIGPLVIDYVMFPPFSPPPSFIQIVDTTSIMFFFLDIAPLDPPHMEREKIREQ